MKIKFVFKYLIIYILVISITVITGVSTVSAEQIANDIHKETIEVNNEYNCLLEDLKDSYEISISYETLNGMIDIFKNDVDLQNRYERDPIETKAFLIEMLDNLRYTMCLQESNKNSIKPFGGLFPNYTTAVTPVRQATTYWCGPAAGVQALIGAGVYTYGLSNYDGAQSTMAQLAGTTTAGTDPYSLKNAMSSRIRGTLGTSARGYTVMTVSPNTDKYTLVNNVIGKSIQLDRPCVVTVLLKNLPYYTGSSTGGHYITIRAINGSTGTATIVDPHYNSAYFGEHTVTYSQLRKMIDGRCLIYATG